MSNPSTATTGNDPVEGLDPGGTHSTKPGNPDKSGPSKPAEVRREQSVVSGDQDDRIGDKAPAAKP